MSIAPVQPESTVAGPGARSVESGIITPEAVVLDIDTAGFASRILAGLIDVAIQVVVMKIGRAHV